MSLVFRLAGRRLASHLTPLKSPEFLPPICRLNIKVSKYRPPPDETHDERNMRLGRPQSPHLTIYAAELPSMLSITHRLTGAAMSFYTVLFGFSVLILPQSIPHYIDALGSLELGFVPMAMLRFIFAFPFCYHMCNGLRHLIWDLGVFLSIKAVYLTGYTMLTCAFSLTLICTLLL